jgi:hypothetical protein
MGSSARRMDQPMGWRSRQVDQPMGWSSSRELVDQSMVMVVWIYLRVRGELSGY